MRRMRWRGMKRFTKARNAVLKVLSSTKDHLSVEEIFYRAKKFHPGIGLATVYRTVELLKREGFLRPIKIGGLSKYEWLPPKKEHAHLICISCGNIFDIKGDILDKVIKTIKSHKNFEVKFVELNVYGICEKCKKATTQDDAEELS